MPPLDMQAPVEAYTVFYILFAGQLAGALAWMAWRARKNRTWLPVVVLAGAFVAGWLVSPVYNALTFVWFPSNIPHPLMHAFGMNDPAFDPMGYALFIGFGGWVLYEQLKAGRGARAVWLNALGWGVADLVYEVPFLNAGMYTYYGDQPFEVFGFPIHWVFLNAAIPVISGLALYLLIERSKASPRTIAWGAAFTPAFAAGMLMIAIFPIATMLNADVPSFARQLAAIGSAAIALCILVGAAKIAERSRPAA